MQKPIKNEPVFPDLASVNDLHGRENLGEPHMVTNYEGEAIEFKETLPLLPVRDLVVYPFMILPLFVGRETSIKAVEESYNKTDRLILLSSQKDITAESPSPSEIYEMGTVAMIMRMRRLPDGRIKILIQGLAKARIKEFVSTEPFYQVKVEKVETQAVTANASTVEALARATKENLEKVISLGKVISPDILMVLEDIQDPGRLSDLIASNLNLKVAEAQKVLEIIDPVERLGHINQVLLKELEVLAQQAKLKTNTNDPKNQKEFFLREQIKAMKQERLYAEPGLTIGDLAARVSVQEYRLRKLINQSLHYRNFNQFLNRYRIEEAARRLLDPEEEHIPISSIALDVGYASLSSFNKAFKEIHGVTPSVYRSGQAE